MSTTVWTIVGLALFIPAIVFHEVAHGYAAYRLGDPTAKSRGRLSLNPLKHIDPFGSVLLPLLMAFSGGPIFGYAKPVPYNPRYFKDIRKGELIVGLAGPAANLVLALIGAVLCHLAVAFYGFNADFAYSLYLIGAQFSLINLYLMFFNLLPIPPLDGSSIITPFLSDKALKKYYQIQQYALFILILLIVVVPYIFNVDPLGIYLDFTAGNIFSLLVP